MNICIPKEPQGDVKKAIDDIKTSIMSGSSGVAIQNMRRSANSISLSLFLSVVYSIVFIYFLSAFAETISWICIAIIQLGLIGATAVGYFAW